MDRTWSQSHLFWHWHLLQLVLNEGRHGLDVPTPLIPRRNHRVLHLDQVVVFPAQETCQSVLKTPTTRVVSQRPVDRGTLPKGETQTNERTESEVASFDIQLNVGSSSEAFKAQTKTGHLGSTTDGKQG